MRIAALAFGVVAIAFTTSVAAQSPEDLLKKNGCTACHAIDKKVVGPAYMEVSEKYKNDKGAAAKLFDKVKKGGSGVWGQVPMPPNPQVSDAELKQMLAFIVDLHNKNAAGKAAPAKK